MILLCENNKGYENLIKLVSLAFLEGFYNKPRVDIELLKKYNEGLICMSACISGEVARLLNNNEYENAKKTVEVNGKDEEITVPFAMLSGVVLDSSKFSNVKVTNGKQIDEGKSNIIVGMAFPGLSMSIDLDGMKEKATDDDAKKQLDKF